MDRSHQIHGKHIDVKKALSKAEMERAQGGGNSSSGFRNGGRSGRGNYQSSGSGNWSGNRGSGGDWSMPNQGYNSNTWNNNPWETPNTWTNNPSNNFNGGGWGGQNDNNFGSGYQQSYLGGSMRGNNFQPNRPTPYGKCIFMSFLLHY